MKIISISLFQRDKVDLLKLNLYLGFIYLYYLSLYYLLGKGPRKIRAPMYN